MNHILALKIVNYVIALESLFNTDSGEISHKVSERIAFLLSDSSQKRLEIFMNIKKAYSFRSKIVHGDNLRSDYENLKTLSITLDMYLRSLLTQYRDFFDNTDEEKLRRKFNDLIFGIENPR